ncbi:unnamed protein product [Brachionus calyciflorus]|uniref:Uncharacterized protein n=1 Tax=Brachionus calyciflorus TaxID=104777 RepID=A0A813RV15_9BILA|nr:unnamed protein product [Brachionus calyciflorus]
MIDIESDQTFSDDEDVILPSRLSPQEIALELDKEINQNNRKRKRVYWGLEEIFSSYDEAILQFRNLANNTRNAENHIENLAPALSNINQDARENVGLHLTLERIERKIDNYFNNLENISFARSMNRIRSTSKVEMIMLDNRPLPYQVNVLEDLINFNDHQIRQFLEYYNRPRKTNELFRDTKYK